MRPFASLLAALALAACGDGREPLLVYSPHGRELTSAYEAAFEAAHPEVDVRVLDMGSQDAYDRIRTERANPQAGVWWGAPSDLFARAADEGLLAPFTPTWAAAVPPEARDPQGRWFGTFLTPEVIAYNTQRLDSAEVPADWDDLLGERWRGRVVIRSPLASGTMRTIFGAMILRQPTVEQGMAWLARLDLNTADYPADPTQLYLKLARGEADLTLWNLPDIVLQARDNGYPFGYRLPASGTPVVVDGIAVVAGAPDAGRARAFVEFVTTPEALVDQARRFYRLPARTDVPADSLPDWMRRLDLRPLPLDGARLARDGPAWMQAWDEEVRGRGADYLRAHPLRAHPEAPSRAAQP